MPTTTRAREAVFTLPHLPPSMNSIYTINHVRRSVSLSDAAVQWQQSVLQNGYIPRFTITEGSTLQIDCVFSFDWTKRRFDVANLMKLLIDTVAKRLGFNDRIVRHGSWKSEHNTEREFVVVKLIEIRKDV